MSPFLKKNSIRVDCMSPTLIFFEKEKFKTMHHLVSINPNYCGDQKNRVCVFLSTHIEKKPKHLDKLINDFKEQKKSHNYLKSTRNKKSS